MDENKQNGIRKEDYVFGLDIGASKINLFMGAVTDESVCVLECGDLPLENADEIDSVVETLRKVAKQLETLSSVDVRDVYVGIAGKHVMSFNSQGFITLATGEVRSQDIENVKRTADTLSEGAGTVIHVFPGEYTLDGQAHIKNPKGMSGRRLTVDAQVVTSLPNAIQNLEKCVRNAELRVAGFVLEPLAAAYAVLTNDERELGVALIDIGAASADIAVFVSETVRYTASLDLAGNVITSDISKCLKVPISLSKAEEIKKKYGTCKISNLIEDETFPVPGVGDRGEVPCSRKLLAQVISARVQEIFKLLNADLKKRKVDTLINGGIVLTGGCCALEGIDEIAESVFQKPVRIGHPKGATGIKEAYSNPSFATGIGLLHYAAKERRANRKPETGKQITDSAKKVFQRVKEILRTYF